MGERSGVHKASSAEEVKKFPGTCFSGHGGKIDRQEKGSIKISPYYKLYGFADSTDHVLIIVGTICAVCNGLCMPIMTILFGKLVDAIGNSGVDMRHAVYEVCKVSLYYLYLAFGSGIASLFQVSCWMVTGERQAARIRSLYLKTLLRQDIAFFDNETSTGEVIGRMSQDTILIQDAMGEKVGKLIQMTTTFFGGFTIAFYKGWLFTIVLLSAVPPIVISGGIMILLISKFSARGQIAYSQAAAVVEQTIGSIRTVASFTGEKQAIASYKKSLTRAYKSGVYESLAAGFGFGVLMFMLTCSYAFAVWYGAKMIIEKGYSAGKAMNVMFAVLTGSLTIGQSSPCLTAIAAGQAAASKMFEAINRTPSIDAYSLKGLVLDDICGDIELRNVHFSYPSRPHEKIFEGFSFSVPSGTTAALVGQSGSGKSTVINLIERFYDPQAGKVLIDGINLKRFQLRWIREKIGLVSQEPVLFSSSIGENIAYGKDGATIHEIREAARLANASEFIDRLPQGLDTTVGEHGIQLSGGQKQRVAIARAILKDPRILLLDEATSALDAGSERVVQEALDRTMINRTTLIVAHRLITVRNADVIAVLHRGKIVEKGTHSELLNHPDGAYCQIMQSQGMDSEKNVVSKHSSPQSFSAPRHVASRSRQSISGEESVQFYDPSMPSLKLHPEVPIRRLAILNKPEIPIILLGAVFSVVNGAILPGFGLILSDVIQTFYEPSELLRRDSKHYALIFVLLGLASLVAYPMSTYLFAVAGCKLIRRIRSLCFEKLVYMEISWFDEADHSSGVIGARLSTDAASVRSLVGDSLALVVQNAGAAIAGMIIAFRANCQLALIILVLVPLLIFSGYIQVKFIKGFSADAKVMYEEASQVANDAVSSIRTIASFCAEEKVMQLYNKKCETPMRVGIRHGIVSGIGFGLSSFFMYFVYAVSFFSGAKMVDAGHTTFDQVFHVFLTLSMAALGISQSSSFATDASKAKSSAASVFAILDRRSKIDSSDRFGAKLRDVKGDIEFLRVNFKYPTRSDIQILRDFSLKIESGKTVALVGESGSGKSTVISLLQRFYDPDKGCIKLDGIDIKKLQLKWFRQQIGVVSQEPVLFNDSIRANIAYGKEGNATEAEILAAAELANAHSFVSSLKEGYDTKVGERGVQLSGGQKQRVAIARAIVKAPKILLLDEATSALDTESEIVVQDALDRIMVKRTTLVIAHRLSTIRDANVIVVVKNGVIAEKGRHNALIGISGGIYASMVALHVNASSY